MTKKEDRLVWGVSGVRTPRSISTSSSISCVMQSTVLPLIELPEKTMCHRAEVFL